jgi:zinc and cadmium transporter
MNSFLWIMISTFIISLISFIGIFTLALKEKLLDKIVLFLVSLSAGALMGGAFLHLLPESVELREGLDAFLFVLVGFALFFLIEKVLHWRHCHNGECEVHTFTYMNLIGDSIHNFIDGLIMATSFVISIPLGLTTTMAIAFHEIPQEIGDFGVLIYGGFTKKKALVLNFLVALTAVLGGLIGFFISNKVENVKLFILPFAAGGFLYIAASDLIPEIRKEVSLKKSMICFGIFILGIFIMYAVRFIVHE